MNEFGFFAVKKQKSKKKTNSFVGFLGESTARQSAYGFLTLSRLQNVLLVRNLNPPK
jgi:hypothetical protein